MTQQPDPFSELRGLIEAAKEAVERCPINTTNQNRAQPDKLAACRKCGARMNESCGMIGGANYAVAKAAQTLVPALLDERDRLIEALTEMRTAGVYLCGCRARGAPKAFIPIAEQKFLDALDLARQALSQEIG